MFILKDSRGEHKVRMSLRPSDVEGKVCGKDSTDRAVDTWRKSGLSRDLEQLLAVSVSEDALEAWPNALSPLSLSDDENEDIDRPPSDSHEIEQPLLAASTIAGVQASPMEMCEGQLPVQTADLVDSYFISIHCWFPILERRDILRIMHSETAMDALKSGDKGMRTCLWALIALLASQSRSNVNSLPSLKQILTHIWLQVAEHNEAPELGHIQAILIAALLNIGWGHFCAAWILVGQAARMILVLQQRPTRYAHTVVGCFILDNFLSALLGRKAFSGLDEQLERGPLDEDCLDEWELWNSPSNMSSQGIPTRKKPLRALSTFNLISWLMIRLTRINQQPVDIVSLRDCVVELQRWKAELPTYHQWQPVGASTPPLVNLHLTWNFVMCAVLLKATTYDTNIVMLMQQTAGSTLEILDKHSVVGLNSPLLQAYAFQARKCLQDLNQVQLDNAISSLTIRLEGIQKLLVQNWTSPNKNLNAAATINANEERHQSTGTEQVLELVPGSTNSTSNTTNSIPITNSFSTAFNQHPGFSFQPLAGNRMQRNLPEEPGVISAFPTALEPHQSSGALAMPGGDQLSEINDFDALFDEVSPFVPAKR